MRMPQTPPDYARLLTLEPHLFERVHPLMLNPHIEEYVHWDKLRRLPPPDGFTHEEWWAALKIGRMHSLKALPLRDTRGVRFKFTVPDRVAAQLHEIDMGAGGKIGMPEQVTNPQTRDQYVVSTLMQEAITSSQLEGAVTTREVAKEMLRSGRAPSDTSERMIANNYATMQRLMKVRGTQLTTELVFELHRTVTDGTLRSPDAGGRFRRDDEPVTVEHDITGEVFHYPPPAADLPERMRQMCDFANDTTGKPFVHPVLRAILLHFWLAYDHPFVDGNGRTARALFYWLMLHHGYWLFEFISISDILLRAPTKYYRAFLYAETDGADATYFIVHQAEVIREAIARLHQYIERKSLELQQSEQRLRALEFLNHRQVALLSHAMRHPGATYTFEGHQRSHGTVYQTARRDLLQLCEVGILEMRKRARQSIFSAPADMDVRIAAAAQKRAVLKAL